MHDHGFLATGGKFAQTVVHEACNRLGRLGQFTAHQLFGQVNGEFFHGFKQGIGIITELLQPTDDLRQLRPLLIHRFLHLGLCLRHTGVQAFLIGCLARFLPTLLSRLLTRGFQEAVNGLAV